MNRRPEPARISLLLTLLSVLWLTVLHHLAGAHEHSRLPLPVCWLRDASFALPAVLGATLLGLWAGRRVARAAGLTDLAELIARATALAVTTAAALAALNPVHAQFFGSHELSGLAGMSRDGFAAVLVLLPASLAVLGPRRLPRLRLPDARQRRATLAVLAGVVTVVAGSGTPALAKGGDGGGGNGGGGGGGVTVVVPTSTDPGNPCPADAPKKSFDVQALNVRIPINRYGDNDPQGRMYALTSAVPAVRAEEASQQVSVGLRDDAIQPLVVRANLGDCVTFRYTNNATALGAGGDYGMHIDGLSFTVGSSGDTVGKNLNSAPATGGSATYVFYIPNDPTLEGAHYIHPGPGNRAAVDHGLFGALSVQPAGSTYRNPTTGAEQVSGWEADIIPAHGKAFREGVKLLHEIGHDNESIFDRNGAKIDEQDKITGSYRPGSFALNYRSEPFKNRLIGHPTEKSHGYSSYTFGDPATPMPRGYLGDPTKFRILHSGGEKFHVYHLHGGGDRWRANPHADKTYDYADTGLRKDPPTTLSPSQRLDSQSMGPGEAYNLEIEGGAGGVQQSAGDFLFHCHIAKHYVSGMWSFWRVFNTRQADLLPLPDRAAPPQAVDSTGLIGKKMPDGTTLDASNLDSWVRPQLPPRGVPRSGQDAAVWNYTVTGGTYLGEPEDLTLAPDSISRYLDPAHPNRMPGDQMVGNRPKIMFDPTTGRPAYPLLRTHIGTRPPFTPNGHSGAPYLGEQADQKPIAKPVAGAASTTAASPWANRKDGICPTGRKLRTFNVVAIETAVPQTKTTVDPDGKIFVLAKNKDKVKSGEMPAEPLAIRSNQGDCDAITLTNEMTDAKTFDSYSKTSMHIHHVQFDVQGSDGVTAGFAFEHSVRPYKAEDPTLTAAAAAGSTTLRLSNTAKFQVGEFIAAGEGLDTIDINEITAIAGNTVTLAKPLANDHAAGEWAGIEFIQYRWYPDVVLDNIFWHDHVDGIHGWGHGLVGQLIVEPAGSTYHDPRTGAQVDSGTLVDIRTSNPMAPGVVDKSFRELALWTINDNDKNDRSTLNLRSEPLGGRDPATRFSSYVNGDPLTPLPQAYPKDPIVIRSISVSPTLDTLHVQGARFATENRYVESGEQAASLIDTIHHGISERTTLILNGGGGGPRHKPGDYLYFSGSDTRMNQGAWGLIRVLPGQSSQLQPLPDNDPPAGRWTAPGVGAAPATVDAGNPCPSGAPTRAFQVSAVDVPGGRNTKATVAYVRTSDMAAVKAGAKQVEPLVLHVAAGECVQVDFRNDRTPDQLLPANPKASFSVAKLDRDPASSGVNAGYTSEQNVSPGRSRRYVYYADSAKLGSATIADFGADSAKSGLYGAAVVAPAGATFTDPVSGVPTDVGSQVDVHAPGGKAYRDFTLNFADDDFDLGRDFMGYVTDVKNATVNYAVGRQGEGYSSWGQVDPATPVLRSYPGDEVRVHALSTPGSEQGHVFSLGGLAWPVDPHIGDSNKVSAQGFGPWESVDAVIAGGAGGWAGKSTGATGDFFYGDLRRPFTVAGMWGYQRVLSPSTCALKKLDGSPCATSTAGPAITGMSPASGPVGSVVSITGTGLTGTQFVAFSGAPAVTATVVSDTEARAAVPAGAVTGPVKVTTRLGNVTSAAAFTVTAPTGPVAPVVSGVSPGSGRSGTVVTLTGTGFSGATAVTFGNVAAQAFTVASATSMTATVPAGAVTGVVRVTTPAGSGTSGGPFTVINPAPPTITGFSPGSGPVDTPVTISGANLGGVTAVAFGGAPAVFTVNATGVISTKVPAGATTGRITVTTSAGTATSGGSFTVSRPRPPAPKLTDCGPGSAKAGSKITIRGNYLGQTSIVSLGGVRAKFVVVSNTQLTVTIPKVKVGRFTITTPGGTATCATTLIVR